MQEYYIVVIGDNPEQYLKAHSSEVGHWKDGNWLYGGLILTGDYSSEQLAEAVTADQKFMPTAVIDNGRLISKKQLGNNWESSLKQCLAMTNVEQGINIYICHN